MQKNNNFTSPGILFATLAILAAPIAMAQTDIDDKFSLSVGLFVTERDTSTRVDASGGGTGSDVDLETEFGLDASDSVFRIDGYWRFRPKHRIDATAFDLSRRATKQIGRDIDWNGTVFPISTTVDSDFDLKIYKVAYTWSFMQRDNGYLGLTAGLYVADIGASVSAPSIGEREVSDVTAPLPVIGLRGEYEISEKWSVRASGELFALEYDDFDGSLFDFYAGIDYQLFDHTAIGIGINSVGLDVDISNEDLTGNVDWQYDGGLIFLKFDF